MIIRKRREKIHLSCYEDFCKYIIDNDLIENLININCHKELFEFFMTTEIIYHSQLWHKINPIFNGHSGTICNTEYWIRRGYTQDESLAKINNIQRKRNPRCIEYWVNKGFTPEDAKKKVSALQAKSNAVKLEKYTREELKKISCFSKEYWKEKGFTDSEAQDMISLRSKIFTSRKYLLTKYTEEEIDAFNQKKAHKGKSNGMYKKTAPIGSGNGISGYYKNYYVRSLYEYFYIKDLERSGTEFVCLNRTNYGMRIRISDTRTYCADFYLTKDNTIVEVKSAYYISNIKDFIDEIRDFCAKYGYNFKIVTEKDITFDWLECKRDFENGMLKIDKKKVNRFLARVEQKCQNVSRYDILTEVNTLEKCMT